jgi:o-succinylbenzoate synthase
LKILDITANAWDVPMRSPYRSAQRITTTARNVLVTVTLADGSIGYGESAPATYVTGETQESVLQALTGVIPALRGAEAEEVYPTLTGRLSDFPGAAGALEIALADALAHSQGVPLYRFLGAGADVSPTRATDLSLPILTAAEASVRAAQAAQDGFHALKIKVGAGDLAEDAARVRAIAEAAPEVTLRLDGNQGFTPEEAVRFIEGLSDLAPRIEMLEQPTKAGDDTAMAFVSQRIPFPVFADESVHHVEDASRMVGGGICGGVVLKLAKSGLSQTGAIARATHAAGGRCLFGCMMETRIAVGAALSLTIALGPEIVPMLDLDGHLLVNDAEVISGGLTQSGDVLILASDKPGLGLTAH